MKYIRELVQQLLYTMFISNNCRSFYLWWKENLVNIKTSENIMEVIFCKIFFWFLWTAKFIKNSYIWGRTYFIVLKNVLKQT